MVTCGLGGGRNEQGEHRGFLGQWDYSRWCCNGECILPESTGCAPQSESNSKL